MDTQAMSTPTPAANDSVDLAPPRPGRLLIVCSVAVIVVSVLLAPIGVTGLLVADPWSSVLGMSMLLITLAIGVFQYAACFRGSVTAAKRVAGFHCAGLVGFAFVGGVSAFEWLGFGRPAYAWSMAVGFLLAALAGVSAWNTAIRASRLIRWREAATMIGSAREDRPYQFSILEILLITTAVAVIAGMTCWMSEMDLL